MSIVFAAAACSVRHGAQVIRLQPGDPWAADDPFVMARPDLFASAPPFVHRTTAAGVVSAPVEQATAAPGERRIVGRAR